MKKNRFDLGEYLIDMSCDELKNKYKRAKIAVRTGTLVPKKPQNAEEAWRFELPFPGHYLVLVLDSENLITTEVNGEGLRERDVTKGLLLNDGKLLLSDDARKYFSRVCVGQEGRSLQLEAYPCGKRNTQGDYENGDASPIFSISKRNAESFFTAYYSGILEPALKAVFS